MMMMTTRMTPEETATAVIGKFSGMLVLVSSFLLLLRDAVIYVLAEFVR